MAVGRDPCRALGGLRGFVDATVARARGQHNPDLLCAVTFLSLREGNWDENRELLGNRGSRKVPSTRPTAECDCRAPRC